MRVQYNAYIYNVLLTPSVVSESFRKKGELSVIMEGGGTYHLESLCGRPSKVRGQPQKERFGMDLGVFKK